MIIFGIQVVFSYSFLYMFYLLRENFTLSKKNDLLISFDYTFLFRYNFLYIFYLLKENLTLINFEIYLQFQINKKNQEVEFFVIYTLKLLQRLLIIYL